MERDLELLGAEPGAESDIKDQVKESTLGTELPIFFRLGGKKKYRQ